MVLGLPLAVKVHSLSYFRFVSDCLQVFMFGCFSILKNLAVQ